MTYPPYPKGRGILNRMEKRIYNYIGIGFWSGAGVYSLINMLLNLKNISQNKVLAYNYLIFGVAVFGLILNIILIKRKGGRNSSQA